MGLRKDLSASVDLHLELIEVVKIGLDLFYGPLKENACDFRRHLVANEALNVRVNEVADEFSEVGIPSDDTWEHAEALSIVGVDQRISIEQVLSSLDLNSSGCLFGRERLGNWLGNRCVEALGVLGTLSIVIKTIVRVLVVLRRPHASRRVPLELPVSLRLLLRQNLDYEVHQLHNFGSHLSHIEICGLG